MRYTPRIDSPPSLQIKRKTWPWGQNGIVVHSYRHGFFCYYQLGAMSRIEPSALYLEEHEKDAGTEKSYSEVEAVHTGTHCFFSGLFLRGETRHLEIWLEPRFCDCTRISV